MISSKYKYFVALVEKFQFICQESEAKGWDWMNNFMNFFEKAHRYHYKCEFSDRKTLCVRYFTPKNEYSLVSFTIYKEGRKFRCNPAFGFPSSYADDDRYELMYDISRDCLYDLERLEESNKKL